MLTLKNLFTTYENVEAPPPLERIDIKIPKLFNLSIIYDFLKTTKEEQTETDKKYKEATDVPYLSDYELTKEQLEILDKTETDKTKTDKKSPPLEQPDIKIPEEQLEDKNKGKVFKSAKEFVNIMLPLYTKVLKENGIDTKHAAALVAQAALESGWGKSVSGRFNYGGIKNYRKGMGTYLETTEEINGKLKKVYEPFRNFRSLEEYVKYKVTLLTNDSRYKGVFDGDYITNISKSKYATLNDEEYEKRLRGVYNTVLRISGTPKGENGIKLENIFKIANTSNLYNYLINNSNKKDL